MSNGYNPGDIFVDSLVISSQRGTLDLTKSFVTSSVYESIFTPGIMADIDVLDTNDELGQLKIVGDETVSFAFKVPGGESATYKLALHKLDDNKSSTGAMKSKQYTLKCVSEEAFHAKTNYVQKNYNTQISGMVKDIVKDYLKSNKEVEVEETKGSQKIIFQIGRAHV